MDRTGQSRKKSLKYFTYLGRSPHRTDLNQNFAWLLSSVKYVIRFEKFQREIFRGHDFAAVNFSIFHWFLRGAYNRAALMGCLYHVCTEKEWRSGEEKNISRHIATSQPAGVVYMYSGFSQYILDIATAHSSLLNDHVYGVFIRHNKKTFLT